ncbi:ATP-binding cassette domain-containing protein [Candidatus Saccharibacteria bacterium]|nr:ATP-binding cassette domain-containing protein [Candidatus Saccharibacteria bacterium]
MLSIAGLIFTYTYLSRTTDAMFGIASVIRTFEQAFLDAAPMTKLLAQPCTVLDIPNAPELMVKTGSIDIRQARFSYGDTTDAVFSKLTLHIAAGERVGLAGPSGGGKSTLTKLLLRFADLENGSICIDGQDIAKVTQRSLRSHIAYVPQEPFLFHRSLRDNIAYGIEGASDAQILDAARRAHALEFIETMPKGLDTIVGERGVKLSGGQRQRIAIARAILKDAPILILDEATSALDSESEHYIQSSLEDLMKNRTVIVIAHRLSTIAKLDRIVVLKQGKVVEDGPHEKLIKAGGTYAKLWAHQSGGFIDAS